MTSETPPTPRPYPPHLPPPATLADRLEEKLQQLFSQPTPDVLTLNDFKTRYRLTRLGGPANRAIAQSLRINQTIGDTNRRGLAAAHVGLIYLHEGDSRGAAPQFSEARRQWRFADNPAALALACYAEGQAHEYSHQFETAVACYDRARQWLSRATLAGAAKETSLLPTLQEWLDDARQALRTQLWERDIDRQQQIRPDNQSAIAPPHIQTGGTLTLGSDTVGDDATGNDATGSGPLIPGHSHRDPQYQWYRVEPAETAVIFPRLPANAWLLVRRQPPAAQLTAGVPILVHVDTDLNNGMLVTAAQPAGQPAPIYLGRLAFGYSPSTLNTGTIPVVLTPDGRPFQLSRTQILAQVVGEWQPIVVSAEGDRSTNT